MSQSNTDKGVIVMPEARKAAPTALIPQSESAAILEVIGRAAMNPQVDIEKMERLFAIQQQITSREAEVAYNNAMAAAQMEMDGIVRTHTNKHTRSMYADLDAIHKVIKPVYTKYGFSLSFSTGPSALPNCIAVKCVCRHAGGHSVTSEADYPLDIAGAQGNTNKTAIQAMGSTQTYARRYMETMVFNIAMRNDNDGNSDAPKTAISAEQLANIEAMVTETGSNRESFAKFMKVEKLSDLPATSYEIAVGWLEAKRKKGAKK